MKIKVGLLTSFEGGVAAHHTMYLADNLSDFFEITCVIRVLHPPRKNRKYWIRKIKKILKIGILGTFNGIRIRPWFTLKVEEQLRIKKLKEVCSIHGISFFEVNQLNSDESREIFNQHKLDLAVSLGNGFIAPSVYSLPKFGMINVHHEILPEYQNAQSVIWQLYNRSKTTGYTIHRVSKQIDDGEIVYQEAIPINLKSTLEHTVSSTIADVWNHSAIGLHAVLINWNQVDKIKIDPIRKTGHYTTPSLLQFMKIWARTNKLRNHKT